MSNAGKELIHTEWVASSQWRTLLGIEAAVARQRGFTPAPAFVRESHWPSAEARHFDLVPLPTVSAAVVFLAGRAFLLGAPKGVADELSRVAGADELPADVVILSSDREHVEGLPDYWQHTRRHAGPLQVWTSNWLWERLFSTLAGLGADDDQLLDQFRRAALSPDSSAANRVERPVTFEEAVKESLAAQINIELAYLVDDAPRLCARFRFGRFELAVTARAPIHCDHAARILGPRLPLLPSVKEYEELFLDLADLDYPGARKALEPAVLKRIGQLMAAGSDGQEVWTLNRHESQHARAFLKNARAIELVAVDDAQAETPVNVADWNGRIFARDSVLGLLPPSDLPADLPARASAQPILLMIGAGSYAGLGEGRIGPDRTILIGDGRQSRNVSLIGLKLLEHLLGDRTEPPLFSRNPVIVVSAETEDLIKEHVTAFLQMFPAFSDVRPLYLRQRRTAGVSSVTGAYRQASGSYAYRPAGHLDGLQLLSEQPPPDFKYCYFTSFNNLGRNINAAVARLVDMLEREPECPAVFELATRDDPRHGPASGSYWVSVNGHSRLLKPHYWGREEVNDLAVGELISTNSLLARLPLGPALRSSTVPFIARASDRDQVVNFERDLDQLTWQHDTCRAVVLENSGELQHLPRFLPVKNDSDLRTKRFEHLVEAYRDIADAMGALDWTSTYEADRARTGAGATRRIPRLFELMPVPQHDPWGGDRIMKERGEPDAPKVSETWETSTLRTGVSRLRLNCLVGLPLTSVDPDGTLSVGKADVMAKFLDCNDWLSIQLHPSADAAARLHKAFQDMRADADGESRGALDAIRQAADAQQDWLGKEEVFHVIDATREATFIIGVESARIREILPPAAASLLGADIAPSDIEACVQKMPVTRLAGLVGEDIEHRWEPIAEAYADQFRDTVTQYLAPILHVRERILRSHRDEWVVGAICLSLALKSLHNAVRKVPNVPGGLMAEAIDWLYGPKSPLLRFFHKVGDLERGDCIRIPPGVIHAAGPGLFMTEMSEKSDNTLRLFDHGREFRTVGRPLNHVMGSVFLTSSTVVSEGSKGRLVDRAATRGVVAASSELRSGSIWVRTMTATDLKEATKIPLAPAASLIVLCGRGRVSLQVSDPSATLPTETLELGPARAAIARPRRDGADPEAPDEVTIRGEAGQDAFCVIARALRQPSRFYVCVEVGISHFTVIVQRPGGEPIAATRSWQQVLPADAPSWEDYASAVRREVQSVQESAFDPGAQAPAPDLIGLSWPGLIAHRDGDTFLRSPRLGLDDERDAAVIVQQLTGSNSARLSLFDATADLASELIDHDGLLRTRDGPALYIGFADGICASLYDGNGVVETIDYRDDGRRYRIVIRHLGRILWLDPVRRTWHVNTDANSVLPPVGVPPTVMRLSNYLSVPAVVWRWLSSLWTRDEGQSKVERWISAAGIGETAAQQLRVRLDRADTHPQERSRSIADTLTALARPLRHLSETVITDLNSQLASGGPREDAAAFVRAIGHDFGDMLGRAVEVLGEPFHPYAQRIVIGGFGGTTFGAPQVETQDDIFLDALRTTFLQHLRRLRLDGRHQWVKRVPRGRSRSRLLDVCRAIEAGDSRLTVAPDAEVPQ